MKTAADIFLIVLYFGIFGFIHSFLALNSIKKNISEKTGNKIAFYRLFYNAVAVITLFAIFELSPKPDLIIYELKYPYDIIIFFFQGLSLIGIVWSFASMDLNELLGISQLRRYYSGAFNPENLDAELKLDVKGPNRICRHPLYLFFILFLGLRPYMDLFYLVFYICAVIYVYIGSYYEEKKLIERFGNEYIEYKKNVSKIFPVKLLFKTG